MLIKCTHISIHNSNEVSHCLTCSSATCSKEIAKKIMLCIIGVTLTTGGGKWYRAPLSMAGGSKKKIGMGVEVVVPSMKSSECFEV